MFLIPSFLLIIQIFSAISIVLLILFQQGKGSEMDSFSSSSASSFFGSTGSANFMSRMTKWCAVIFFSCTISISYMNQRDLKKKYMQNSVMESISQNSLDHNLVDDKNISHSIPNLSTNTIQ
ncbi:MAG: preprotein translocase subunit SecG [Bordetella sp.]|nr:MAG: preprotein translocase subunit SecG [Bordetella sp.]